MSEHYIDNELVKQKNEIIRMIQDGEHYEAKFILDFVAPLWNSVGYGYKERELQERLKTSIEEYEKERDEERRSKRKKIAK